MIEEAISKIAEMALQGMEVSEVAIQDRESQWFYDPKAGLISKPLPVPARGHKVLTFSSLKEAVEKYKDLEGAAAWVSLNAIAVVLDDADKSRREDRLFMELSPSSVFNTLNGLQQRAQIDQKDLVRMLRTDLRFTDMDVELRSLVERVKFTTNETTEGTLKHGSDSLGLSVHAEAAGTGGLPEEVEIKFHAYPSLHEELEDTDLLVVKCVFEVFPRERYFRLAPLPGEMERARWQAVVAIQGYLRDTLPDDVSVFAGTL